MPRDNRPYYRKGAPGGSARDQSRPHAPPPTLPPPPLQARNLHSIHYEQPAYRPPVQQQQNHHHHHQQHHPAGSVRDFPPPAAYMPPYPIAPSAPRPHHLVPIQPRYLHPIPTRYVSGQTPSMPHYIVHNSPPTPTPAAPGPAYLPPTQLPTFRITNSDNEPRPQRPLPPPQFSASSQRTARANNPPQTCHHRRNASSAAPASAPLAAPVAAPVAATHIEKTLPNTAVTPTHKKRDLLSSKPIAASAAAMVAGNQQKKPKPEPPATTLASDAHISATSKMKAVAQPSPYAERMKQRDAAFFSNFTSDPCLYPNRNAWGVDSLLSYDIQTKIGEGTYGYVFKAVQIDSLELVALKKIRLDGSREGVSMTALREIKLLKSLSHNNIVCLRDVITANDPNKLTLMQEGKPWAGCDIYLVFDFMDHDLTGLLSAGIPFNPLQIYHSMYQLLLGLDYLHDRGILHRDIKGSNLLLNAQGVLKIGDFGLARECLPVKDVFENQPKNDQKQKDPHFSLEPKRLFTNQVITLWYRPPELLLGEEGYDSSIDLWSVGCILADLHRREPLFRGRDELSQFLAVTHLLGTFPTEDTWPGVTQTKNYAQFKESLDTDLNISETLSFETASTSSSSSKNNNNSGHMKQKGSSKTSSPTSARPPNTIEGMMQVYGEEMVVFLLKFLELNPSDRITCKQALADPYFDVYKHKVLAQLNNPGTCEYHEIMDHLKLPDNHNYHEFSSEKRSYRAPP